MSRRSLAFVGLTCWLLGIILFFGSLICDILANFDVMPAWYTGWASWGTYIAGAILMVLSSAISDEITQC